MVFQRDKGSPADAFETGLPPAESGEDVPHWLVILGLAAGLTMLVALLRYAIDLLGVVFVIILVGFAIRALSDWLTEGESVSGWAISALAVGLIGTVVVGVWLFNSGTDAFQNRLPGPVQRTVAWLEVQGWGQRVLLPASGTRGPGPVGGTLASAGDAATRVTETSRQGEPVAMSPQPPVSLPAGVARVGATRPRPSPPRPGSAPGEAAASQPAGQPAEPAPPPPEAPPAAIPTSLTLTASPARTVVGQSVRLTAQVRASGAESTPAGTVTFTADGALLGRASVRAGLAVLVTLNLAIGDHVLSAAYDGDGTHLPSHSSSISQTVARR